MRRPRRQTPLPVSSSATLVATLTTKPDKTALRTLADRAQWLEVRADLVGDLDAEWLRSHFSGRLLYTLRSRAEGGAHDGGSERRRERQLGAAAAGYDYIDLEAERDLDEKRLLAIAADRRVLSWHGVANRLETFVARLERMSGTQAFVYKLVPAARRSGEDLLPLSLLHYVRRSDVVAFASGPIGTWTRLIAPRLGAPLVYAATGDTPGAPGQPTLDVLIRDFGMPDLPAVEGVFGIVGNPVAHSLSPRLHNGLYRALGLPYLYLPFEPQNFAEFWIDVVESGSFRTAGAALRGLSVTTPFKEVAQAVAGASSPLAEFIGSANTLVLRDGVWEAESTDPDGVVEPLKRRGIKLKRTAAAVVGAGGAGRAAAVGLAVAGAAVTLVNRTAERGRSVADQMRLPFCPLDRFDPGRFRVIVNATPLGRSADDLPFAVDSLGRDSVLVDMVYQRGGRTGLVDLAGKRGATVIDGREVLLSQALKQFELMTGKRLDRALGERLLGLELSA